MRSYINAVLAMLLFVPAAFAITISGTVVDLDTGEPVADAWVVVTEINSAATTDESGSFTILFVPGGSVELVVSHLVWTHPVADNAPIEGVVSLLEWPIHEGLVLFVIRGSMGVERHGFVLPGAENTCRPAIGTRTEECVARSGRLVGGRYPQRDVVADCQQRGRRIV